MNEFLRIMIDRNISNEQKNKEVIYKNYVDCHIKLVNESYNEIVNNSNIYNLLLNKYFNFSKQSLDSVISYLNIAIQMHDYSKYSKEEWEPYRRYFYPINENEKKAAEEDMNIAWKHHYKNNDHHWEHWKNNVDKMPIRADIEQCADWIAMSKYFKNGTALDFYNERVVNCKNSEDQIILGDMQSQLTKDILTIYYGE